MTRVCVLSTQEVAAVIVQVMVDAANAPPLWLVITVQATETVVALDVHERFCRVLAPCTGKPLSRVVPVQAAVSAVPVSEVPELTKASVEEAVAVPVHAALREWPSAIVPQVETPPVSVFTPSSE